MDKQIKESELKDSINFQISSRSRPNSQEINKRISHLKNNLSTNLKHQIDDDIVNFQINDIQMKSTNPRAKSRDGLSPLGKLIKNAAGNSVKKISNLFGRVLTEKALTHNLRNNFQRCLGKLNENDTKEIAFQELKSMISSNNTAEGLRIFISLLSVYYNNCTQSAKEIQVLLIGYIASMYKENLIDPLDKPPNIIKTIVRVSQIIQMYLKEKSIVIQKACSLALQELYDHCMTKDDIAAIILIFFDPLISMIMSGSDTFAQIGASVCLSDMISHLGRKDKSEAHGKILTALDEKIINLAIKHKNDNQYVFEAMYSLMELIPFECFSNSLKEIYERLIKTLNFTKLNYQTKIMALKIFTLLGKKLKSYVNVLVGFYLNDIILTLENCACDRIHKVQISANEALKEWRELQEIHEEIEKKKTKINPEVGEMNKENIIMNYKKMDKFNLLRNLSKINKNNEENKKDNDTYAFLTENLKEEIYKKGIGNVLKLSNIMKNKNQLANDEMRKSNSNRKNFIRTPTQKVNEEIKDYIRKSANMNKSSSKGFNLMKFQEGLENEETEQKVDDCQDNFYRSENYNRSQDKYTNIKEDNDKEKFRLVDSNIYKCKNELPTKNEKRPYSSETNEYGKISKDISSLFSIAFNSLNNYENQINLKLDKLDEKILNASAKIFTQKSKIPKIINKPIEIKEYNSKIQIEKDKEEILKNIKIELNKSTIKEKESPSFQAWNKSIREINNNNYDQACRIILESGDDIYLLRLLCITGCNIINKISITSSRKIIKRINMISRSHRIQYLLLNLVQTSYGNSSFFKFDKNEQNELLETLFEYSGFNSSIGSQAASLYAKITSIFN